MKKSQTNNNCILHAPKQCLKNLSTLVVRQEALTVRASLRYMPKNIASEKRGKEKKRGGGKKKYKKQRKITFPPNSSNHCQLLGIILY